MGTWSKGRWSKAISDRSGMQFPYNEMVKEWTGALVHTSEYESKQPQLQPPYHHADPQALLNPRPDRTEFKTATQMPPNPFSTAGTTTITVFQPSHGYSANDIVRFSNVNVPSIGGLDRNVFNLETTLNGALTANATTVPLADTSDFPTSGYIFIKEIQPDSNPDAVDNSLLYYYEVIKYTGIAGGALTGLTRGTSAQFFGVSPATTSAQAFSSGTTVYGGRAITPITQQRYNQMGVLENFSDKYTFTVPNAASSTTSGGSYPVFAGPVSNTRTLT